MFHAVRQWWSGGRGKVTARLFAFEFLVVVLGVLVAQATADWVRSQADRRDGQRLVANLVEYAHNLDRHANYWHAHAPCLRDHVDRIARQAVAGKSMTVGEIGRPGLPSVSQLNLSEDDWHKITLVAGAERAQALGDFVLNAESIERYSADISDQWATFKLLDGSIGPPSAEDRARVRLATAIVDNRLRWLIFNYGQTKLEMKNAGLRSGDSLPDAESVVDSCGLLKAWQ